MRILCAINTDPLADAVFEVATEFAEKMKAELALFSVIDESLLIPGESGLTIEDLRALGRKDIQQMFARLKEKKKNIPMAQFIEEGNPSKLVVSTAHEWRADLIVIASHARTGLSRLLMGSVAEAVIRHATCPVLVVPNKRP